MATTNPAAIATPIQPDPSLIAGGPTIISIRSKKRRLSGAELKARSEDARKITGYDKTSPIFGKQTPDVLTEIEGFLADADKEINRGNYALGTKRISQSVEYIRELQKRTATRRLTFRR